MNLPLTGSNPVLDCFLNYKEMVKQFENLNQLNRFEKLNKGKKIIDIVYNAENKLWRVTFNVLRLGCRFNAAKPLLYAVADLETKI